MKSNFPSFFLLFAFSQLFSLERPNIVFILADDLGYGDIKAFGGDKSKVPTPHFDQLCQDGMKFTNAHYGGNAKTYMNVGLAMGKAMIALLKK